MSAIPLADATALRPHAHRTLVVRLVLALACVGAALAVVVVARHPHTRSLVPVSRSGRTIVVLDLSASISSDVFSRIGATLASLARGGGRVGLVVFSEQAYEALPPGTPTRDLRPLVRYFTLPAQRRPGFAATYPPNPWGATFTGGTRISAGLELAHSLALSGGGRAGVVLVSDLDDDPSDVPRLASVLLAYRRDRLPVRIVGLNASPGDLALFDRLLEPRPSVVSAPTLGQAPPSAATPFPWLLLVLTFVAAAAAAAAAAWLPRLEWGAG